VSPFAGKRLPVREQVLGAYSVSFRLDQAAPECRVEVGMNAEDQASASSVVLTTESP